MAKKCLLEKIKREPKFDNARNALLARYRELMGLAKKENARHYNRVRDTYQPVRQMSPVARYGRRGPFGW